MNKKLIKSSSLILFSLILPYFAKADLWDELANSTFDINIAIANIRILMWTIFGGLSAIMFIFAGITFLSANGDPSKIAQAKKAVVWAVVGIVVTILGFFAKSITKNILGV